MSVALNNNEHDDLERKISSELVRLAEFYVKRGNATKARELLRLVDQRRDKLETRELVISIELCSSLCIPAIVASRPNA